MAEETKRKRGRPPTAKKMTKQLNVRVDDELSKAVGKYQERHRREFNLRETSDAVRHILQKVLVEEGLLPK